MDQKILTLALYLGGFTVLEATISVGTDTGYVQEVQASMAKILRDYVEVEIKKLEQLKKHADELDARLSKNISTVSPVSIYMQTKKLHKEWEGLYKTMSRTGLSDLLAQNLTIPRPEHLGNMVDAIFRIQDVYQFDAIHIASGIPELLPNSTLSAEICRDLGLLAFEKNDRYHALVWFQAAVYRLQHEATPSMDIWDLYPLLALSLDKKNNTQRARQVAQDFKERAPQEKVNEIFEKYPHFANLLEVEVQYWLDFNDLPAVVNEKLDGNDRPEKPKYEMMCRQEANSEIPVPQNASILTCYYDRTSPYLLLAPAKIETLCTDPFVAKYCGVISDEEIDIIQGLAIQKMGQSAVGGVRPGVRTVLRESSTAWLTDKEHPVVARVRSRVAALTKLDMSFAEHLQVVKYGLGGHYGPHYDSHTFKARHDDGRMKCSPFRPIRVATFMFYFAVPDHGGATIFPLADLINDAIFWYNLHRDGNNDAHTLHAGCPVISGSKWVANQWFVYEQQVTRPCALTEDKRRISNNLCSCSGRVKN